MNRSVLSYHTLKLSINMFAIELEQRIDASTILLNASPSITILPHVSRGTLYDVNHFALKTVFASSTAEAQLNSAAGVLEFPYPLYIPCHTNEVGAFCYPWL